MANFDAVTTSGAILGSVLVTLRTQKGVKQADLAAAVGIGPSTWSRIEKGESSLSIDQLRKAAKALSITPGEILELIEKAEEQVTDHGIRIETSTASLTPSTSGVAAGSVGAAAGAALGSVVPIVGTALGAVIGGALAHWFHDKKKSDE